MTPPLYETPAPPSSSIQVTFAFFVGTSENRIARLPRYPDSPNMALALHAARRPTLLFEFLDYPHQSLNFLFLESFVVQPQLRIGGSIGIQRDQSKAYLPLSTSKCHTRPAPLHLGRDSSGALLTGRQLRELLLLLLRLLLGQEHFGRGGSVEDGRPRFAFALPWSALISFVR